MKPLTPKATVEHANLAVLKDHLSTIPSLLGRLARLSELQDSDSNRYHHVYYDDRFGFLEVDRALCFLHRTLFDEWLGLTFEDQTHDFNRFITSSIEPVENLVVADPRRQSGLFMAVLPAQAIPPDRELFQSGITILLRLTRSRVHLAADSRHSNRRVTRLLRLIQDHAAPWRLTLDEMADEVRISGDYVRHLFKAATGLTVRQFLRYLRLARVATLLRTTFLSIEEVALKLDYEYTTNCSRDFRTLLHASPTAYRIARGQCESPFGETRNEIAESDQQ